MNDSDTTITLAGRMGSMQAALQSMRDPQQRLAWVVDRARGRPAFAADRRTDDRLVKGCAARLWLEADFVGGRCRFACDSDSAILKSLAGLLCELYDDLPPSEVVGGEPDFLESSGILAGLTENRRRTVQRVRAVILEYARARVGSKEGSEER